MRSKNAGYSLMEVMVAIVILVIALPALTNWVLYSRNAQVNSLRQEAAGILAQQTFDSLAQLTRSGRIPHSQVASTSNDQSFQMEWVWQNPSDPYDGQRPGACKVTISWKDGTAMRATSLTGALP